jgi:hypothetical protein
MLRTELPSRGASEPVSRRAADLELLIATVLTGVAIVLATVIVPGLPA